MRESYLLLEEPWIPAIDLHGKVQKYGIRPLLEQAHELYAITDGSPLVEYGLYRLLCVFLMDALNPPEEEPQDLTELLKEGRFDTEAIDGYIGLCRAEGMTFDLFDPERPFLQTPFRAEWDKKTKSVSVLDYTIPNGNNHAHFDHRDSSELAFSYDFAARILPAALLFCTAAAQGYPSGVNGAPPYFALIQGKNLFETLVFSMLDVDQVSSPRPFRQPPVWWRNPEEVIPKKVVPDTSWLHGMLFPTRRILLVPEPESKCVRNIYLSQGMNYQIVDNWTDPHVTYWKDSKGRHSWKPRREEAVWRNLNGLLDAKGAPLIVRQYTQFSSKGRLQLQLYGVQTNQGGYLNAAFHDMRLPVSLLGNEEDDNNTEKIDLIAKVIRLAEQRVSELQSVLNAASVSACCISQAVQELYDRCEQEVWKLCDQLDAEPRADLNEVYRQVGRQFRAAFSAVLNQTLPKLQLRGRRLLELAGAEDQLYKARNKRRQKEEANLL